MTRRSGRGRVTRAAEPRPVETTRYPSLRHRSPWAFWVAVVGAVALVLSTFAASLSAFL